MMIPMSNYADMICKTANDGSPPQLLNSNRICAYLQEAKNEEGLVLQLVMQQIQCGHSDSIVHPPLHYSPEYEQHHPNNSN
jgi:hypothetical protein